jgi:Mrp family chromosome partitioning ATPase
MPVGFFFALLLCSRCRRVIGQPARQGGLATPIERPREYWRGVANSRTSAIANVNGGVGKATSAANLGAYVAKKWQKRALPIDLDFQGSSSSMAFPGKD